jgi:hypothetical protein
MATRSHASVRNPLTLMAVFAGLAEVSATVALPQLDRCVQSIFVWFVITFPFGIVLPFFVLLWFRPHHLYGPGDFRKDPTWLTEMPGKVDPESKKPKAFKQPRGMAQADAEEKP